MLLAMHSLEGIPNAVMFYAGAVFLSQLLACLVLKLKVQLRVAYVHICILRHVDF